MFFNVLVAQWASDADLNKGGSPKKVGGSNPWGNPLLDWLMSFTFGNKKFSGIEIWMLIINAICILHYLVNPSLNLVHRIEINFSLTLFPLQQKLY